MRIEILLEVCGARQSHGGIETGRVSAMRHCSLLELPENDASGKVLGYHVVLVVDLHKVVDDTLVVWHVSVAQLMYLMEDVMHFFHILGWSDP